MLRKKKEKEKTNLTGLRVVVFRKVSSSSFECRLLGRKVRPRHLVDWRNSGNAQINISFFR